MLRKGDMMGFRRAQPILCLLHLWAVWLQKSRAARRRHWCRKRSPGWC